MLSRRRYKAAAAAGYEKYEKYKCFLKGITGIKSINSIGVCPEENWEYDINRYTEKPTDKCYDIAKNHKSVKYRRVKHDFDHLQECLKH